ncbi:MAG: hypothetical protein FJ263_11005 [Planctomycetes bacterium]|nr:hypothetical protein [Planctomycetota bacterium]
MNYPSANSWFIADASGNVTITFNTNTVSDGWLPAQYRIGVSNNPSTWTIAGSFQGWSNNNAATAMTSLGGGIYRLSQTLATGEHWFKSVVTGSWDSISSDGRSVNTANMPLTLAADSIVDFYVNTLSGTIGIGGNIILAPYVDFAHYPNPKNGAVVGTSTAALSWTNPDPNYPADAITCDVYFLDAGTSKLTKDPNMGPTLPDTGVVKIANAITASTVTLPTSFLPLQDNHYYYWAVHCTDPHGDPNTGGPVTTKGDVWYFYTGDAAPVVSKPADQYMYLSQNDSAYDGGENNPNIRWFQVTASYTDDGKSPITDVNMVNLNWGWDPANGQLGVEKVSQDWPQQGAGTHTSGTVTAVYKTHYAAGDPGNTTTLPGYWQIRLDVTGSTGTANGAVGIHRIFATCKEAAVADPADPYEGYYDTNGDCIVRLSDFADFAEAWLTQSVKYE